MLQFPRTRRRLVHIGSPITPFIHATFTLVFFVVDASIRAQAPARHRLFRAVATHISRNVEARHDDVSDKNSKHSAPRVDGNNIRKSGAISNVGKLDDRVNISTPENSRTIKAELSGLRNAA